MSQPYLVDVYDDAALDDLQSPEPYLNSFSLVARSLAEAFGTFVLILGITGAAVFSFFNFQGQFLVIALVAGLSLFAAHSAVGHISGGHFNPAISFGSALAGRLSWKDMAAYMGAQIVGAVAAVALVWATTPQSVLQFFQVADRSALFERTANGWGAGSGIALASNGVMEFGFLNVAVTEIVLVAVLVGAFFALTSRRSRVASPAGALGGLFAVMYLISWPVSNASVNPVRAFSTAVFSGSGEIWGQVWLFVVAPLLGAGLAALFALIFTPVTDNDLLDDGDLDDEWEIVPADEADDAGFDADAEAEAEAEAEVTEVGDDIDATDDADTIAVDKTEKD